MLYLKCRAYSDLYISEMFLWEESILEEVLSKNKLFIDMIDVMTFIVAGRTRTV